MNILKSCSMRLAISLMTLNGIVGLTVFACTKSNSENTMTGVWIRDTGTEYLFFDDSRFQQSDRPGEQWIWDKKGKKVFFYGNPERTWTVDFLSINHIEVIESDTFELYRK